MVPSQQRYELLGLILDLPPLRQIAAPVGYNRVYVSKKSLRRNTFPN